MTDDRPVTPRELEARARRMHPLLRPFALFIAYLDQTAEILHNLREGADLSIRVIEMASGIPPRRGFADPTPEQSAADAERIRTFVVTGIPIANGHALVGVWGAFEAWSKDLACARAQLGSSAAIPDQLVAAAERSASAVPLSALLRDRDATIADAVVEAIEVAAKGGIGLGAIEARLEPLGLGVAVTKETRDSLYYAEKIRHIYAHRAGLVDAKFVRECPSLGAVEGERYNVDSDSMRRFLFAFRAYVNSVLEPVGVLLNSIDWPSGEPDADATDSEP